MNHRFFKETRDLPDEMMRSIAEFLPLKDVFSLAMTTKAFRAVIISNVYWNRYLLDDYKIDNALIDNSAIPLAFETFRDKPASRAKFRYVGINGKSQVIFDISKIIDGQQRLNEHQKEHMRSNIVQKLIINGDISLDAAVIRAMQQKTEGLEEGQLIGIKVGLTREQVANDWFDSYHAKLIKEGVAYETIKGLKVRQYRYQSINLLHSVTSQHPHTLPFSM
jgi:hypothetical protein